MFPNWEVMRCRSVRLSLEAMDAALGTCDPWQLDRPKNFGCGILCQKTIGALPVFPVDFVPRRAAETGKKLWRCWQASR